MSAIAAATLVTCASSVVPARGSPQPQVVPDGVVAWEEGRIIYAGPRADWEGAVDTEFEDACAVPGFVDCHTHLPFVGWRDDEYEARLAGRSYRDLHGEGGIPRSARMLAASSDEEVLA